MNAITARSLCSTNLPANCFTLCVNMRGITLVEGIEVNTYASRPGIYLASDDSQHAWTRYAQLDHYTPPQIMQNKVFRVEFNGKGFLTTASGVGTSCIIFVKVFDPLIRKVNGTFSIETIDGTPEARETVWKKHGGHTVGVEALHVMRKGDAIAISYPGGSTLLGWENGSVKILSSDSPASKKWEKLQEEHRTKLAAEAAASEVEKAQKLAMTFPKHPMHGDWCDEVARYADIGGEVGEAFLTKLFEMIVWRLKSVVLGEDGLWFRSDIFKMHLLYEVCQHLPKESLAEARRCLRNLGQNNGVDLPHPIVVKFLPQNHAGQDKQEPAGPARKSASRLRHEANKATRAEANRNRARAKHASKDTDKNAKNSKNKKK